MSERVYDFIGKRTFALGLSVALMLVSLVSLGWRGLNLGLDFTGGALIEVEFSAPIELQAVRDALQKEGFESFVAQYFGTTRDVVVRLQLQQEFDGRTLGDQLTQALQPLHQPFKLKRVEYVGAQVGAELAEKGSLALFIALVCILIYVALRFEFRFALGAVAAVFHDVLITAGVFSVFAIEFDLTTLAALLAVIGYSLNDTIVIFDRVRENFRKMRKITPDQIFNVSITQTLSRTIVTSLVTLLSVITLYFFGGKSLQSFSLALIVGIIVGSYSTVYIASAIALILGVSQRDFASPVKEGA